MKLILFILFSFILVAVDAFGQQNTNSNNKNFTIVFYNTENFYDTIHSQLKNDTDYLPASQKKWTGKRYFTKINNIAKVLSSINLNNLPEIICLSEVENKTVLNDLVNSPLLKNGNYNFVEEEVSDLNGLCLALLYRKDFFRIVSHRNIPVNILNNTQKGESSILFVRGIASKSDTLNIFINQWKSRTGGIDKTESKRLFSAMTLRSKVDSLMMSNPKSKIIIVGNFNDEPTSKSLFSILQACNKRYNISENDLYNLMYDKHNINAEGTFYNKGTWNMFDNIIVSYTIFNPEKGLKTDFTGGEIFKADWLMSKNPKTNELTIFSTYKENKYSGGYSNHLPVYVKLKILN